MSSSHDNRGSLQGGSGRTVRVLRVDRDDLDGGARERALAFHRHPEIRRWDLEQMAKGRARDPDR